MKFLLKEKQLIFENEGITYALPQEDITRLASRPGTRVIRILNKEGDIKPMPVRSPIGEIEGFEILATLI